MLSREEIEKLRSDLDSLQASETQARKHHEIKNPSAGSGGKLQSIGKVSQIGFEFLTFLIIFSFGGFYLDKLWKTKPIFFFIGTMLGFGLGLYRVIRGAISIGGESDNEP